MIQFTRVSGNSKTGPIPVSGSPSDTCPPACPFAPKDGKPNGCYAAYGPISWQWAKLNKGKIGFEWSEFLTQIKRLARHTLWRHNQFGDLKGFGDSIDTQALADLVKANKGRKGFTYTHKPVLARQGGSFESNASAVKTANALGFAVNLSANNMEHADELKSLDVGPVASVVPENTPNVFYTPKGNKGVICPAQQKEGVTCASCKLCSVIDRSIIVGFKAHGVGKKKVEGQAS